MNNENIADKIKRLIAQNRTEEAIKYLADYQFNNLDKEVIILNNRFNKVTEEQRLGVLSREEANRELIQINLAIIDLTSLIKIKSDQEQLKNEMPKEEPLKQKRQIVQEQKEGGGEIKTFTEPGFMQKNGKYLIPLLLLPLVIWGISKMMTPSKPLPPPRNPRLQL